MKITSRLILFLLPIMVFSGCQPAQVGTTEPDKSISQVEITVQSNALPTFEPYTFKTSVPGTVTIRGRLLVMDPTVMLPDPNDGLFLVPLADTGGGVSTIPPFNVGEVSQAEVDERTGDYAFTNIQPGQYAIVVLTKAGAQVPARFHKDGSLAIITINESDKDKIIDLDYIQL